MDKEFIRNNSVIISILLSACLLFVIYSDGLAYMVRSWESEEYSHGYLIPVISLWLIWENREKLSELPRGGNWTGLFFVIVGLIVGFVGELATLFVITQYAFLLTLYGLCLSLIGWKGVKLLWFPLAYLIFMIPLPNFLYNSLSAYLQLISSSLGVSFIRLCDISVFLEGNVIDLGTYKLQVVEACSGLRYLFPLASFGFLCAYFFHGKWWMRAILFLSTLPITVLMNSFRIGVIGVLVENWGIEQADGFLHDFEGWVVFIGCLAVLLIEMWLMVKIFMPDKSLSEVFVVGVEGADAVALEIEPYPENKQLFFGLPRSYAGSLLTLVLVLPLALSIGDRAEVNPDRTLFSHFPLQLGQWRGVDVGMEQEYIDALKFDDYIIANYTRPQLSSPINFYVAYYASQRKGASVHSPKSCIPGGGWKISDFKQQEIKGVHTASGQALKVNRAIISKGSNKQIVYYWFQQRGRVMTNEYLVKWYLFWDSFTRSRTDGALVRLVVPVAPGDNIEDTEHEMERFLSSAFPLLEQYVPN